MATVSSPRSYPIDSALSPQGASALSSATEDRHGSSIQIDSNDHYVVNDAIYLETPPSRTNVSKQYDTRSPFIRQASTLPSIPYIAHGNSSLFRKPYSRKKYLFLEALVFFLVPRKIPHGNIATEEVSKYPRSASALSSATVPRKKYNQSVSSKR